MRREARELQLLAKVALVTVQGFIQEVSPTPRCKMIAFKGSCEHKGTKGTEGWPGEREVWGERGAQAVSYNLPPSREEK